MSRHFACLGIAAALLFAGATRVEAGNMLLEIQQGASVTDITGTSNFVGVNAITVGDYSISFAGGSSNTPGTSFNAILNAVTLTVTKLTETSAAPLVIRLLADDYSMPTGNPLYLGSSLSATFTGQSDNSTVDFVSYFDANNTRTSFTNGVGTAPVTIVSDGSITDGSGIKAPTISVNNPNATFSLSSVTTINLLTVGQGTTVDTTGATEVRNTPFGGPGTDVVPEPASLALLAFGGLGLLGARVRRNRKSGK